jgi:hypothetical protein
MGHKQVKEWFRLFRGTDIGREWWMFQEALHMQVPMIDKVHSAMLQSWRITIRSSPTSWGFCLVWYSPFWQKIWAWNTSQRNMSQNC